MTAAVAAAGIELNKDMICTQMGAILNAILL